MNSLSFDYTRADTYKDKVTNDFPSLWLSSPSNLKHESQTDSNHPMSYGGTDSSLCSCQDTVLSSMILSSSDICRKPSGGE